MPKKPVFGPPEAPKPKPKRHLGQSRMERALSQAGVHWMTGNKKKPKPNQGLKKGY